MLEGDIRTKCWVYSDRNAWPPCLYEHHPASIGAKRRHPWCQTRRDGAQVKHGPVARVACTCIRPGAIGLGFGLGCMCLLFLSLVLFISPPLLWWRWQWAAGGSVSLALLTCAGLCWPVLGDGAGKAPDGCISSPVPDPRPRPSSRDSVLCAKRTLLVEERARANVGFSIWIGHAWCKCK